MFQFSHSTLDWMALSEIWGGGGEDFLKTFLETSVDHIIYRDNVVNWSSFINYSRASASLETVHSVRRPLRQTQAVSTSSYSLVDHPSHCTNHFGRKT